jgi:hypothetical protein
MVIISRGGCATPGPSNAPSDGYSETLTPKVAVDVFVAKFSREMHSRYHARSPSANGLLPSR